MSGTQVFDWIDLPHNEAEAEDLVYPAGRATVWQWGVDAAQAAGIDLAPWAVKIVILNSGPDHGAVSPGAVIFVDTGAVWEPTFVAHEMGHGFGLSHSWSGYPDLVYGDRWDIMSAMSVWTFSGSYASPTGTGPGLNVPNLRQFGKPPASRVWSPSANAPIQQVRLAALNAPETDGYLAAVIAPPLLRSKQAVTYTIEYRRPQGWDRGVPGDVVLVHEVRADGTSYLLSPQLTPGSPALVSNAGDLTVRVLSISGSPPVCIVELAMTVHSEPPRCGEIREPAGGAESRRPW
jgi:hypothetical protein